MSSSNCKKRILAITVVIFAMVFSGCRHVIIAYGGPRRMVVVPAHTLYVPVVVAGEPYYYCEGVYYRRVPEGYVVSEVIPPQEVIINVANANGSYTPVKLQKLEGGYIGPQGEFYPEFPSTEQLQAMYGG